MQHPTAAPSNTRTRITHHIGDPVRRTDDRATGVVTQRLPGNDVVVRWPSGLESRQHASELIAAC